MQAEGSVTYWIGRLKAGDHEEASRKLWDAFAGQVVAVAKARLAGLPRLRTDAEDVALGAFDSFLRRASKGQFPRLENSKDLWALLLTLTCRKAARLAQRGSHAATPFTDLRDGGQNGALPQEVSRDPDPAEAAAVADEVARLLSCLTADLRQVALLALEGYTNGEIGARMVLSEGTIGRKLRLIRETWKAEFPDLRQAEEARAGKNQA